MHILTSPDIWDKPVGKGCLMSWGSHVIRRHGKSDSKGATYNLQAAVEEGERIRAAIAHIDNKLGERSCSSPMIGKHG